jgi:hypothetical protein
MEMQPRPSLAPRFWIALQPSIVRVYKAAGLVALTAILVGLVGFLIVNIFYFFDHTWVRPVVLSPNHQKVVEASNQLADAKTRGSRLSGELASLEESLAANERMITDDDRFIAEVGTAADAPKTADQWLLRREVEKARLDQDNKVGERAPLGLQIEQQRRLIKDQEAVVNRLAQSPYLKAIENKVTLAFVANQNLRNIKLGTPLYGCIWGLVWCHKVGTVKAVLDGEVQDIHPHDESIQRGLMLEIDVTEWGASETVLFAGAKPLWFL